MLEQRAKTESPIEVRLLTTMTKWGFKPITQVKIGKYRTDILIEEENVKLIVECDGKEFHKNIAGYEIDRDVYFLNKGYKVEHFSGSEIYNDPDAIVISIIKTYFPNKLREGKYTEYLSRAEKEIFRDNRHGVREEYEIHCSSCNEAVFEPVSTDSKGNIMCDLCINDPLF